MNPRDTGTLKALQFNSLVIERGPCMQKTFLLLLRFPLEKRPVTELLIG